MGIVCFRPVRKRSPFRSYIYGKPPVLMKRIGGLLVSALALSLSVAPCAAQTRDFACKLNDMLALPLNNV